MTRRAKQGIVLGVLAVVLAVGVGVGAASGGLGRATDRQAFLDSAAKRLNVTPAQLEAALQGAYTDRLDAAVAAGQITKAQADEMKQHLKDGGLPLFGGGRPHGDFGHHGGPGLDAAASYLGLTEADLHTQLESGKSLAEIAKAQGKSLDGLKKALTDATKKKLDAAVKDGRLTQAQADEIAKQMSAHVDDLVNGTGHPGWHDHHGGEGWGGPPPSGTQPGAGAFVPAPSAGSGA
jgi:hypothetical protein